MNKHMDLAGDARYAGFTQMDWTFYGLHGNGFRLTPDSGLRFHHTGYRNAVEAVALGMDMAEGFIIVTGPPGTGKTTLAEHVLQRQRQAGRICGEVTSTQVGADDLLRLVGFAFGLDMERRSKAALLNAVERYLNRKHHTGIPALLVIDEAQNLGPDALEELRLLGNLASDSESLLQIILLGQDQLIRNLQQPKCEQLRQHIVCTHQLRPMDALSARDYIAYRLSKVGWTGRPRISGLALQLIHQSTGGIARNINGIMSRLLWLGTVERLLVLDSNDVRKALAQFSNAHLDPTASSSTDPLGLHPVPATPVLPALDETTAVTLDAPPPEPASASAIEAVKEGRDLVEPGKRRAVGTLATDRPWAESLDNWREVQQVAGARLRALLDELRLRGLALWRVGCWGVLRFRRRFARMRSQYPALLARVDWRGTAASLSRGLRVVARSTADRLARAASTVKERWWSVGSEGFAAGAATAVIFAAAMLVVMFVGLDGEQQVVETPQVKLSAEDRRRLLDMVASSRMEALREYRTTRPKLPAAAEVVSPPAHSVSVEDRVPLTTEVPSRVSAAASAAPPARGAKAGMPDGGGTNNVEMYVVELVPDQLLDQIVDPMHIGQIVALASIDDLPPPAAGPDSEVGQLAVLPPALPTPQAPVVAVESDVAQDAGVAVEVNVEEAASEQTPTIADRRAERIASLLARADAAMQQSRYTIPTGRNAHEYYRAVLSLDPENPDARAGLSEITRNYRRLARERLDAGDIDGAELMLKRALRVEPNSQRLMALSAEIDHRRSPPPAPVVGAVAAEPPLTVEDLPVTGRPEPHPSGFWPSLGGDAGSLFSH